MKRVLCCLSLLIVCFVGAKAQPRIITKEKSEKTPAAIAPVSFKAKYEGGMFGFNKEQDGYLKFDDANFRFVFFDKNNKEQFGIPYKDLILIYPNSTVSQSTGGKVMENVPLPGAGIVGMLMKDKRKYLVINFDDPELDKKGTVNFKINDAKLLAAAIETLGNKAEMQARGDSYYRPLKKTAAQNQ